MRRRIRGIMRHALTLEGYLMPYALFHSLFPEIAEQETRTITVFNKSDVGLPPGQYAFVEMFCDEPKCDCRRVFFYIVSAGRSQPEAVIAYGWETREFYAKWMHEDDPTMIASLRGPELNLGSPQSALAPALLEFVREHLLQDAAYVERVKRHYRLFRDRIDGKEHRPKGNRRKCAKRKA
jgi:hypothetical protein